MTHRVSRLMGKAMGAGLLWLASTVPLSAWEGLDISRPAVGSAAVQIFVTVFVVDVDNIDTANQSFDANIYLEYLWQDLRLAHKGPGVLSKPLSEIWWPRIVVVNEQRVWATFPEMASVSPEGEVVYRQRLWGSFSQPLELRDFPFDRQTFTIQLAAVGFTPEEVDMIGDPRNLSGIVRSQAIADQDFADGIASRLSVADWVVIAWNAQPLPYQPIPGGKSHAGFAFSFEAQRLTAYFIVKVILPLLLIVAMSWVVFWMDPREVGSKIGVSVTSMLTLIAYRFAVDTSLPNLPYLTRLDYFILSSTFLVFLSLTQVTISSILTKKGKLEKALVIDRWSRILFPVLFALVTLETLVFRVIF